MPDFFARRATLIPDKYKDEFSKTSLRENLLRVIIGAAVITAFEIIAFFFFREYAFNTILLVRSIIVFNLVFIFIFYVYVANGIFPKSFIKKALDIYLAGMLFLCCALSVLPQDEFASITTYVIALFVIAAFVLLSPVESFVIYLSMYFVFFFMLPYYQHDPDAVVILRINTAIMNVLAWILGRALYRMRIVSMLDKKTIEEQNLILSDLAKRDSMTSLFNHAHLLEMLRGEIEKARHTLRPLSTVMVDIDDFKTINDKYGHPTGDKIIIGLARILIETCRTSDIIGRYGGEEFIIIMPDTTLHGATALSERIRAAIEATVFINGIHITVSAGICQLGSESADELISYTDAYLYSAKKDGKNRIAPAFFPPANN